MMHKLGDSEIMRHYLLIDIGGTYIKYSLADENAVSLANGKVATPRDSKDALLEAIRQIAAPHQGNFEGCAISMPGRIDTTNGIAHTAGVLSNYIWEQPFSSQVENVLGVPVVIANDGKCAAAAEAWNGALADTANGIVVVLGTGIGGGIVLDHKVYMGSHFAAGEISNLITELTRMEADDFTYTKIGRVHRSPVWAGSASTSALIGCYCELKNIETSDPASMPTGVDIFNAYAAGEAEAEKALKLFGRRVSLGLMSLQAVLDLEKVAIGGGISAAEMLMPIIQLELDDLFRRCPVLPIIKPELVKCRYGNDANMIGALKFYLEKQSS